jgi:NADH-quinone oxidoreductase subunit F
MKLDRSGLSALRKQGEEQLKVKKRVLVCLGTGCVANGSMQIYNRLDELVREQGLSVEVVAQREEGIDVAKSGCHGFCELGPLVRIEPAGILYTKVKLADVEEIVEATLKGDKVVERLLYQHPVTGEHFAKEEEIPFYKRQHRYSLSECGHLDPEDLREYLAHGGYMALEKALFEMEPQDVADTVLASGLRGRGGGGFPTGRKWQFARAAEGSPKYLVCNGDEGDPGAFMDRSLMEGDPHRLIEGMILAAYAIGASEGYIYVRAEYPLAVTRLKKALADAEAVGILGDNILGTNFSFHLRIKEGAGAFVCGEETALIASIEGERGMPRPKPPFPANRGLWGKPTIINNVETFANVPLIISQGPEEFKKLGTEKSPGTKTFALTGQVANTGLIEVPMGTTLREVVFEIGGGLRDGKEFKAVQIGGPSGGCLTPEHLDLPLDFDSLAKAGAMIGSGGMVVMDKKTCIVEVARFFMNFTQNESCGKCVPCREGTKQMLAILERIVAGEGEEEDLDLLEELATVIQESSLCGLGKTAPNPVLTTLRYFRDEYLAHVRDKKCPAGVCKAMRKYTIDPELCRGCSKCSRVCPAGAISGKIKEPFVIDEDKCISCGACQEACPFGAIFV